MWCVMVCPGIVCGVAYGVVWCNTRSVQAELQAKYHTELWDAFGITFNELFTITNMPIKRFADFLAKRGELEQYMDLLVRNFNPDTADG